MLLVFIVRRCLVYVLIGLSCCVWLWICNLVKLLLWRRLIVLVVCCWLRLSVWLCWFGLKGLSWLCLVWWICWSWLLRWMEWWKLFWNLFRICFWSLFCRWFVMIMRIGVSVNVRVFSWWRLLVVILVVNVMLVCMIVLLCFVLVDWVLLRWLSWLDVVWVRLNECGWFGMCSSKNKVG